MTAERSDALLITWLVLSFSWDAIVLALFFYQIFWKGHSGWWLLFAALLTYSPSLLKALKKRYGLQEND